MLEYASAIGQDSHRFTDDASVPLVLGGYTMPEGPGFSANSDGDVVLHALTNAISGITMINILGDVADRLCLEQGVRDSRVYLQYALRDLADRGWIMTRVSFTIEAKRPRLLPHIPKIRESIADLLGISDIGITATSGEGLSDFGRGEGMMVFCVINVKRNED